MSSGMTRRSISTPSRNGGGRRTGAAVVIALCVLAAGLAARARSGAAPAMAAAAAAWLESLEPAQQSLARRPFTDATRTDWHFVPKPARKGLQLRDMTPLQQAAALRLARATLSQVGYDKSVGIMQLDEILRLLEGPRAKNIRDAQRYFFTVFGTPADDGTWAVSIEGHHLSLNVTVRDGRIVDSTPQFLGANPAVVTTALPGLPPVGHRVLGDEEALAFELVQSLDAAQRAAAVIAAEAPREIRAAGQPQPPLEPAVGIGFDALTASQQALLRRLVDVYCGVMPAEVAEERLRLIDTAPAGESGVAGGWHALRFAWAGSLAPGTGHAYRIEGPTFVIEFCNNQPDAEGNPANHVHCVWRDRTGDFDLPAVPGGSSRR